MAATKAQAARASAKDRDARLRRHKRAADLMKMAGDATRLSVLSMLSAAERNVTDICAELGQSQPAVSHHLALMRASALIEKRRDGKCNFYNVTDAGRALAAAAEALTA